MLPRLVTRWPLGVLLALLLVTGFGQAAAAALPPPPPPPPDSCQQTGNGSICHYSLPLSSSFTRSVPGCGDLSVVFTVQREFTLFYDQSGTLLRQIRHASFTGTITNVSTGQSAPYEGNSTQIYDYQTGTRSASGDMLRSTLPDGQVVFAAGREIDAGPNDLLFGTPQSSMLSGDKFFAQVCQALS